MLIRTITINTNPATQMSLFYQTQETLDKAYCKSEGVNVVVRDDFGTEFRFLPSLYACESVIDNMQSKVVEANQKLDQMAAADSFGKFLEENPEVKVRLEAYSRAEAMKQQQPMMPQNGFRQPKRAR